jgi:hypothetical protein
MMQGGWIHPHVMDCFGMIRTTDQLSRKKEGKLSENEIINHVVIKDVTVRSSFFITNPSVHSMEISDYTHFFTHMFSFIFNLVFALQ